MVNYKKIDKAATKLFFPDLAKLQQGAKQIKNLEAFSPRAKAKGKTAPKGYKPPYTP